MKINHQKVISLYKDGIKQTEIAKMIGTRQTAIHLILRNHGMIPFAKSRLDKITFEQVINLYNSGFSSREIERKLGVTEYDVDVALKKKFRSSGDTNHVKSIRLSPEVDEQKRQLVYGTLLGDGSISKKQNRGYIVNVSHSQKQEGYIRFKAKVLGVKVHSYKNNGFSKLPLMKINYCNSGFLQEVAKTVLINRKKKVNKKWLNKLTMEGVAYWFLDDGCSSYNKNKKYVRVNFATYSFNQDELNLLKNMLNNFGYQCSITKFLRNEKENLTLHISSKDIVKFMDEIKPYVWPIKCMRYKIKYPVRP